MRIVKTILRWVLVLVCLCILFARGLFSAPGFLALMVGVLALPVRPVQLLWNQILPSDSPVGPRGPSWPQRFWWFWQRLRDHPIKRWKLQTRKASLRKRRQRLP